jgi:(2Fe-2S) ferredoxin
VNLVSNNATGMTSSLNDSSLEPQPRQVWICQHRSCLKQGSDRVLAAFQARAIPTVEIIPIHCLGQCGNGPMVRILPEDIWYWQVSPEEVPAIVDRHLIHGHPIQAMLYPGFHKSG